MNSNLQELKEIIENSKFNPATSNYHLGYNVGCEFVVEEIKTCLSKQQNESIDFLNWINNNWYVPTKEGLWKLDIENIEYRLEVPEINIFTSNELFNKFLNKEGEF